MFAISDKGGKYPNPATSHRLYVIRVLSSDERIVVEQCRHEELELPEKGPKRHGVIKLLTKVEVLFKAKKHGDFPGCPMVKNQPAGAGDTGSIPGPGRSHMPQGSWVHVPQLQKPTHLEPVIHNKRSYHNEKPSHHT